jgi:hypothetical protein
VPGLAARQPGEFTRLSPLPVQSGMKSLRFSVLVPLEFHRGVARQCVRAWRNQSLDAVLYEIILLAPPGFPPAELAELARLLRPWDRLVHSAAHHDMGLVAEGAMLATGQFLVFTESHVVAGPEVLAQCDTLFGCHDWAALSANSIPVTGNRLSRVEADMYAADIATSLREHPWGTVLDHCFVTRRGPYFACGGFDPTLGHYAERALAARYVAHGFAIAHAPEVRIQHQYSGSLMELRAFTRDFVDGEVASLARGGEGVGTEQHLLEPPLEWSCRANWNAAGALHLLVLSLRDLLPGRSTGVRRRLVLGSLWRWLPAALGGWAAALLLARIDVGRCWGWLLITARCASEADLDRAFRGYIAALVRERRLSRVAAVESERGRGQVRDWIGDHARVEWPPALQTATLAIGFHHVEHYAGAPFRWSEPLALLSARVAPGRYRVEVDCLPIQPVLRDADLRFFHNGQPLPRGAVTTGPEGVSVEVTVPATGMSCLAWACRPFPATGDRRRLGIPVRRATWTRLHDHSGARLVST